jgi:aspartate/methionine/tyrosine aminotransferase
MASGQAPQSQTQTQGAFRSVPRTGVIFVTTEAQKLGFGAPGGADVWCNFGQGMPECGPLPGAPPRIDSVVLNDLAHEYSPVPGIPELRQAVADMYNRRYRRGMKSQYTAENVAISSGGRTALTRAAAALGSIHLGHFLPDYTAYEELLDIFRLFSPIPIALDPENGYAFSAQDLEREIRGRGLSAILLSNPCNPTGKVIGGEALADWVATARRLDCTLLIDEFYSHYVWNEHGPILSAASCVEDVEKDPVVIFDGLTKNWRYAGWRIAWTVGPRSVIEAVSSAASFLDGGASRPLQKAALPLLEDGVIDAESAAIQTAFRRKRDLLVKRCRELGFKLQGEPQGTFYVFADLSGLPSSISDGMSFFKAALGEKVICVPGEFFDVNPGKRRRALGSRFAQHVRLSFGPTEDVVRMGCDRLEKMIRAAK